MFGIRAHRIHFCHSFGNHLKCPCYVPKATSGAGETDKRLSGPSLRAGFTEERTRGPNTKAHTGVCQGTALERQEDLSRLRA